MPSIIFSLRAIMGVFPPRIGIYCSVGIISRYQPSVERCKHRNCLEAQSHLHLSWCRRMNNYVHKLSKNYLDGSCDMFQRSMTTVYALAYELDEYVQMIREYYLTLHWTLLCRRIDRSVLHAIAQLRPSQRMTLFSRAVVFDRFLNVC